MIQSSELPAFADLEELMLAIMNSPIVVRRIALEARLADWESTRKSADIDDVILAWLASHARDNRQGAALS